MKLYNTVEGYINSVPDSERHKWGFWYVAPSSLTWGEWKKWNQFIKKKYPIQYFFREVIWDWVSDEIYSLSRDIYHLKCLFFRRYHILKLRDNPEWLDTSSKVELALEKLLIDFIEKEKPFETHDWDETERLREAKKSIMAAYEWFKEIRATEQEDVEILMEELFGKGLGDWVPGAPRDEEGEAKFQKLQEIEAYIDTENTKHYQNIIKHRASLWT